MFAGKYKGNNALRHKKRFGSELLARPGQCFRLVKNNLIKGSFSQFYACHYKVTAPAYLNVEMRKIKSLSKHPNNKQTFRQGKKKISNIHRINGQAI